MAVTNFLVSSLPAYVKTNEDILVKSFALAGPGTRARIGLQTGIKNKGYLNYLDLEASFQDGSGCGFNPLDSITLTQRTIETAIIKVDGQICPETLIGKYAEYLVRVSATENSLPFEETILNTLVEQINKGIENLIWLGDTSNSDPIDGFIAQMSADSDVIPVAISGASAYEGIKEVYLAIPEEALERGAEIYVSPAIFRAFVSDLVSLNYYHYAGPAAEAPNEFVFPGSDVRVVKTAGLAGDLNIVATFPSNLVYGCDGENDNESIDLWWSNDDRVFKYQVKWNSGVAYHFPDQIVLGTFAAAPTPLGICPCTPASEGE